MKKLYLALFFIFSVNTCLAQTWYNFGQGIDGDVEAVLEDTQNGVSYAAGTFASADGVAASNVAMWDGTQWSALGAGTNGTVNDLLIFGGNLYAVGSFSSPGNHIAMWDGSSWSGVGGGTNSTSLVLLEFDGKVIVGGAFTEVGSVAANKIASWDGSIWQSFGSGFNDTVFSLGIFGGELHAGGRFFDDGGGQPHKIAKWDGSNWSTLGIGTDAAVWSMIEYDGKLIIGGQFNMAGNAVNSVRVASWDGTNWSSLGGSLSGNVFALGVFDSRLWAGGDFNSIWATQADANRIAVWDGSAWSQPMGGLNGPVYALFASPGALYVGGQFSLPGFANAGITAVGMPLNVGISDDAFASQGNSLESNYPNPFSYSTTIPFRLGRQSDLQFEIRDILGRVVRKFEIIGQQAGESQFTFHSEGLSPGQYSLTMRVDEHSQTRMLLLSW